jgi:hypothetical protein
MSNSILNTRLSHINRPVRPVELPGGSTVHVRDVTLGELRRIDSMAEQVEDADERKIRGALLLCAFALVEPDGTPLMPLASGADLVEIEQSLTTSQIQAICRAAVPPKADAKN